MRNSFRCILFHSTEFIRSREIFSWRHVDSLENFFSLWVISISAQVRTGKSMKAEGTTGKRNSFGGSNLCWKILHRFPGKQTYCAWIRVESIKTLELLKWKAGNRDFTEAVGGKVGFVHEFCLTAWFLLKCENGHRICNKTNKLAVRFFTKFFFKKKQPELTYKPLQNIFENIFLSHSFQLSCK